MNNTIELATGYTIPTRCNSAHIVLRLNTGIRKFIDLIGKKTKGQTVTVTQR